LHTEAYFIANLRRVRVYSNPYCEVKTFFGFQHYIMVNYQSPAFNKKKALFHKTEISTILLMAGIFLLNSAIADLTFGDLYGHFYTHIRYKIIYL